MIRNIEKLGRRLWAEWYYQLTYDPQTKKFTCECEAFIFNKTCRHIKEFKKKLKEVKYV